MSSLRIGELLVENGLVTKEQVAEALQRKKNHPAKNLGQVLFEMGVVKRAELDNILDLHRKRQKLGEILIRHNLIDEAKLNHALALSRKEKTRLGETLVKLHYIEEHDLAGAIASQYDLPFTSLRNLNLDPRLGSCINVNFALRHQIVPVHAKGSEVTIAMAFPLEKQLLREIERAAKITVKPVIATVKDIVEAQRVIYRTGPAPTKNVRDLSIESYTEAPKERKGGSRYLDDTDSPEVEQMLRQILMSGVQSKASDIHLESTEDGVQIRFRVDGFLQHLGKESEHSVTGRKAQAIVSRVKVMCDLDIAERRRPQDGSFRMRVTEGETARFVDFRVSTLATECGEDLVIRILDRGGLPLTLSALALTDSHIDSIHEALDTPSGLFLVTGPTGCGKSATVHAMLARINKPGFKSLSVEDPVEYKLRGVRQAEVNLAVGNTFSRILKAFMRQDPDNILIGEIRDAESASLAVRAALTGHTVLSTLQTNDATSAVVRLLDMGIEPSFIASTLRCVLAQRLVRIICPHCRERYIPNEKTVAKFPLLKGADTVFVRGRGCPACNFVGFKGRRPISELWVPSAHELLQIYNRPDNLSLRRAVFIESKRRTILQDGVELVRKGETTIDELLRTIPVSQLSEVR